MATFPELVPSVRTWTPGDYPHAVWTSLNGMQNRVRNSDVMLSSRLRLQFNAITEAQMVEIITHYQQQYGSFYSFELPSEIWNGLANPSDTELSGYTWRYIEPPVVTDVGCSRHNVQLALETTPQAGVYTNGLDAIVATSVQAGSLAISAGLNETIATSILGGGTEITYPDPDFADVALLLHMDGTNGSTTFADESTNNLSLTVNGTAAVSTAQAKFGTGSLDCTDGAAWLEYPSASGNELDIASSDDFTIEFWIYVTSIFGSANFGQTSAIVELWGSTYYSINLYTNSGVRTVAFSINSGGTAVVAHQTEVELNQWHHVAVCREVTTGTFVFLDGVKSTSSYAFNVAADNSNYVAIGSRLGNNELYIDDFRMTIGTARYTADFTPPTMPFSDS